MRRAGVLQWVYIALAVVALCFQNWQAALAFLIISTIYNAAGMIMKHLEKSRGHHSERIDG